MIAHRGSSVSLAATVGGWGVGLAIGMGQGVEAGEWGEPCLYNTGKDWSRSVDLQVVARRGGGRQVYKYYSNVVSGLINPVRLRRKKVVSGSEYTINRLAPGSDCTRSNILNPIVDISKFI